MQARETCGLFSRHKVPQAEISYAATFSADTSLQNIQLLGSADGNGRASSRAMLCIHRGAHFRNTRSSVAGMLRAASSAMTPRSRFALMTHSPCRNSPWHLPVDAVLGVPWRLRVHSALYLDAFGVCKVAARWPPLSRFHLLKQDADYETQSRARLRHRGRRR